MISYTQCQRDADLLLQTGDRLDRQVVGTQPRARCSSKPLKQRSFEASLTPFGALPRKSVKASLEG
jgi:hypothetical protein